MFPMLPLLYPQTHPIVKRSADIQKQKDDYKQLLANVAAPAWANICSIVPQNPTFVQESEEDEEADDT